MKDLAAVCFGDHAVRIAESSSSSTLDAKFSNNNNSIQNCITCHYRAVLSSRKELIIKLIWAKKTGDVLGSVLIEENPTTTTVKPNTSNCQLLRKRKVSRPFGPYTIHYDLSTAKLSPGPEPVKDFYIVLVAESQLILLLGDNFGEFVKKFMQDMVLAKSRVFSRREQVVGSSVYSTGARFRDGGKDHQIVVRCRGDEWDSKGAEVCVCVDDRKLVSVKRVGWNFRGNQTIFVEEGSAVDVMWDVHDWWFCDGSRSALFVFRARSRVESRLWSDEEIAQSLSGYSLSIQLFNRD